MSPSGLQQIIPLFQRPLKTGGTVQIERKTMKIKREDIDNMSHISVIAAIALPENLEEAARSIPDEVIKEWSWNTASTIRKYRTNIST